MDIYKIVQEFGYTHLYKNGSEIKNIKSIKFTRNNEDEIAELDVKIGVAKVEIEIKDNIGNKVSIKETASDTDSLDV